MQPNLRERAAPVPVCVVPAWKRQGTHLVKGSEAVRSIRSIAGVVSVFTIMVMAPAAHALTAVQSDSALIPLMAVPGSDSVNLAKFDPSLGTLVQVDFILRVSDARSGSIEFTNTASTTATGLMKIEGLVGATAPHAAVDVPLPEFVADPISVPPGGFVDLQTSPFSGEATQVITDNASLDDYIAAAVGDTFSTTVMAANMILVQLSSGTGPLSILAGEADVEVEVIYYIPEPTSLALLALGGFALLRRRRMA